MANVENYLLILGLGDYRPDPKFVDMSVIGTSDNDPAVIKKITDTIDAKRLEWTTGQKNPLHNARYKGYLELIPKMQVALADLATRKSQYEDAKTKVAQLVKRPLVQHSLKGFIYTEEIERVAKQLELPVSVVRNFVTVEERKSQDTGEELKKPDSVSTYKENDARLQTHGYSDIYAFLCEGTSFTKKSLSSASDWLETAKDILAALPPHNTQVVGDKKKICNFCITAVFASETQKKEYDAYLAWRQIYNILQEVKQTASVARSLTKEQGRNFVDDLQTAGASKKKSIAYLRWFCHNESIAWQSDDVEKLSSKEPCPYCTSMIEADTKICPHCGGEIIVKCPKCGKEHSVRERYCTTDNCRYDFNNMKRASLLCEKAKAAIDILNLSIAKVLLDEAEELCKTLHELALLRSEWKRKNDMYGTIVQQVKDSIKKKLFITAERDLNSLKGQFPQYSNPEIEEAIKVAKTTAGDSMAMAKKATDPVQACKYALIAYQSCRDYPGIQQFLAKSQPPAVKVRSYAADTERRTNVLTWDTQKSDVATYRVIRKKDSKPLSIDDADATWEVAAGSFTDRDIQPNVPYYYAITSCIGPVMASLVHFPEPIINLFDVQQVSVQNNKGSVHASWSNVPPVADIEVWRDKTAPPSKPGVGTKVSNVTIHEMSDQGLEDNCTYHYKVFVKYRHGTSVVYSKGIAFTGMPTSPPPIIDYVLVKHKRDNTFEVEWDADDGVSVSFYLTTKLNVSQGNIVNLSDINNNAIRVSLISKGKNRGEFDLPDSRIYYLFPITQKNTTAVVGAIMPVTSKKLISISKVQLSLNDMYVRFDWPVDSKHVLLLYRNDRYAVSSQDDEARRIRVNRDVYNLKDAIVLKNLPQDTYYFSLFAELQVSGSTTFSIPDFYTYRYGTISKIKYDIKVQRILGKMRSVNLVITPPTNGQIPDLIVVAHDFGLPVFRSQGSVVQEIPSQKLTHPLTVSIPIANLTKNTYIKLFTKDEQQAANYEISLSPGTNPCLK